MICLPIIDPELKALVPPLLPEEQEQLEHNIASKRKCYDPITVWEGILIDGYNRFEICMKHGIEFQIKEIDLPDRNAVKVWILTNQLGRRNLTDAARMDMALLKEGLLREKAKKNQSRAGGDKKSLSATSSKLQKETFNVRKELACEAGVGERTLHKYKQIRDFDSSILLEKIRTGEMKVNTAHRLLPSEISKQLTRASKSLTFLEKAIPKNTSKLKYPDLYNKLVSLESALQELSDKFSRRQS